MRAIVNGIQPAQLTLANLMGRDIPLDWDEQRRSFGFHYQTTHTNRAITPRFWQRSGRHPMQRHHIW